ncbi:MAG: hypothetical protein ACJ711_10955, partial [Ornithinibacter sp.]
APIVHADHATPVREHAETSFEEGNGKCARCNYGKDAPGWRTRVILRGAGTSEPGHDCNGDGDRSSGGDHDSGGHGSDGDHSSGGHHGGPLDDDRQRPGDPGGGNGLRPRRVVQVTTPLGHSYDAEPPPLLGWGSLTFPPPGKAGPATPVKPPTRRRDALGRASASSGDVATVPSPTSATEVRDETAEPKLPPSRQRAARRPAEAPGWPHPVQKRKRALRRPRTLDGTAPGRSRPARRPRLTSHLERELCRYLA